MDYGFETSGPNRQALLLFVQEHRQERKRFGFGRTLDRSVHLALQHRTFSVVRELAGVELVVVRNGEVPLVPGARDLPQRGADFNTRFLSALQDTFALGYDRVVVIGGDVPTLDAADIRQALAAEDLAIGPTCDGGFYLAALRRDDLALFDGLPWRQCSVRERLFERIRATGRCCLLLRTRRDIDHAADAYRAAALLLRLVREWIGIPRQDRISRPNPAGFPRNRLPEPRFSSLPPPLQSCAQL